MTELRIDSAAAIPIQRTHQIPEGVVEYSNSVFRRLDCKWAMDVAFGLSEIRARAQSW